MERGKNSSIRNNKGVGSTNHEAILTENDVLDIIDLIINTDLGFREIAKIKNISFSTVNNIVNGKNWTNVTADYDDLRKYRKTYRSKTGRFKSMNPFLGSTGK